MMVRHEERITTSQTAVLITNFLLGTGILTLPRTSVDEVGTPDVWITLVLGRLGRSDGRSHHGKAQPPIS